MSNIFVLDNCKMYLFQLNSTIRRVFWQVFHRNALAVYHTIYTL